MLQVETVLRRFDVWEKGLTFTSLQPYVSLECRRPSHEDCWRIQPAGFITAATDTAIGSGTNSRTEKNSKLSQSSVPRLFFPLVFFSTDNVARLKEFVYNSYYYFLREAVRALRFFSLILMS